MIRALMIVATSLAVIANAGGAESTESQHSIARVTNADVVDMAKARLSDDIVTNAIQQAQAVEFDLSPAGLIALKNAGVSERVIQAMQARAKSAEPLAAQRAPAALSVQPCRIFITEEEPPSSSYVVVKREVQSGKKFYGSHDDNLMMELAKLADKAGADAIIKFHEWRAPSSWSWAAAKAGGMAVKWTDQGKAAVPALKGQCWSPGGRAPGGASGAGN
jgi:hypothetical protein